MDRPGPAGSDVGLGVSAAVTGFRAVGDGYLQLLKRPGAPPSWSRLPRHANDKVFAVIVVPVIDLPAPQASMGLRIDQHCNTGVIEFDVVGAAALFE